MDAQRRKNPHKNSILYCINKSKANKTQALLFSSIDVDEFFQAK